MTTLAETRQTVRGPGGIVRWIGNSPHCCRCDGRITESKAARRAKNPMCPKCCAVIRKRREAAAALLAKHHARVLAGRETCHCGCLVGVWERCPNCLLKARREAALAAMMGTCYRSAA